MPVPERCEVIPLADHQASFRVDGIERFRWHFGTQYPRPFFYPMLGPGGESLTRMGHPGAENHDHHQSVWFAHNKVLGMDFWGNSSPAVIRQQRWLVYDDSREFARMAVLLDWLDGHDPRPLVEQELIATMRPLPDGEYLLELQSTFRPNSDQIEFQQTNFGFLAVRMAKSISTHFGEGQLTGASGEQGEPNLFGKANAWMDYSGPVPLPIRDGERLTPTEGITYFDHPSNPGYPAKWHVRQDGWMGASSCRDAALITTREQLLVLRYMLHIHSGAVQADRCERLAATWAERPLLKVQKGTRPHFQYEVVDVT